MLPNKEPFKAALFAAKRFSNLQARSTLLVGLTKAQIQAGLLEDALETVALIPHQAEKRSVLLNLAWDAVQENRIDDLFSLTRAMLENDPTASVSVGRLAFSLLERRPSDPGKALELLRLTENPFETDRERYRFFEKLIEVGKQDCQSEVQGFAETFSDADYRDWGRLALMKALASWGNWKEAEDIAGVFSLLRRSSWAFLELSRIATENEQKRQYLRKSADLLESVPVDPESNGPAIEPISVQYRILGKSIWDAGIETRGEELLEHCESVVAKIPDSFRRLRGQLFLAKILKEYGRLASVRDYVDYRTIFENEFNGIDRSRLIQWFAEAENSSKDESQWTLSVAEVGQRSSNTADFFVQDEFAQAERITEIVHRFSLSQQNTKPVNDPKLDQLALSGEEFEEFYYSPFSIDDCGC